MERTCIILQKIFQGAVLPTVNAGPLAYAEVFTKEEQRERYGDDGLVKLRESFRYCRNGEINIRADLQQILYFSLKNYRFFPEKIDKSFYLFF